MAPTSPSTPKPTDPEIADLRARLAAAESSASAAAARAEAAERELIAFAQRQAAPPPQHAVEPPRGVVILKNNGLAPLQFTTTTFRDEPRLGMPGQTERKAVAWTNHTIPLGASVMPAEAWAEAERLPMVRALLKQAAPVLPPAVPMAERLHLVVLGTHPRPFVEWSEDEAAMLVPQMLDIVELRRIAAEDPRPMVRMAAERQREAVLAKGTNRGAQTASA